MTTSEFIKLLKEADPSGKAHIRIDGDVPYFAELKEGYWDGPYNYINNKGQWVHSTEGSKVDIYSRTKEDIVYEIVDKWNPFLETTEGLWEAVKEKFVFKLTYVHNNERVDRFLEDIKETFDSWVVQRKRSWEDNLDRVIKLNERGCKFFRKKETENKWYFGWKFINEKNPKDLGSANLAHTYPILESGKFKAIETDYFPKNEYYEYILIE